MVEPTAGTPSEAVPEQTPVPAPPVVAAVPDDAIMRALFRGAIHLRRHMTLYAIFSIFALSMALFPSIRPGGGGEEEDFGFAEQAGQVQGGGFTGGGATVAAGAATTVDAAGNTVPVATGGGSAAPGAAQTGRATQAAGAGAAAAAPTVQAAVAVGTGVTRGGYECTPGVRQIPISAYANPCVAKWEGDNGGATWRGVTATEIKIADRDFPDTGAPETEEERAEREAVAEARKNFLDYFNKSYELYGRKVVFEKYEASGQSNSTEEAQSRGKEGACIDATKAAEELKAFAIDGGSGPYSECAAERKMVVFGGGAYFPESWYKKHHPYIWNGVMECERISLQVAEYMGKRLVRKPAKYAGDPLYQQQERKFGVYVPNNDEYQHCVNRYETEFKEKYNGTVTHRYNYTLDVSRFADEAARAVVQFKAAGVTTLMNACDPLSTVLMTQAAVTQDWRPEWYLIGVAGQDVNNIARLMDQSQVDGHMFGMSQLGPTDKLLGPTAEPNLVYKHITGKDLPNETTTAGYWDFIRIFNFLQAAGPILTPENLARGVQSLPEAGAPDYGVGLISYADGSGGEKGAGDHTGIDDSREIYWDGQATAPDGDQGHFMVTYDGKRFRNGEWPVGDPPIYPGR